jgi:hypothetical protein
MPCPAEQRCSGCKLLWFALAVAVAVSAWQAALWLRDPAGRYLQDFVEYWAAGRLNASGQDPYDPTALYSLQREVSPELNEPVMMWNPPWTLSLAMPFGLLPARLSHLVWVLLQLALVVGCADRVWRLYGGSDRSRWLAWVLALGFIPTYFVLHMGQISPVILLGVLGFLHFEGRGRGGWAGAALVLAAVKPQLVLLVGVAVVLWALDRRRWAVLGGGLLAGVALLAVPLACNPALAGQYWQAMAHRPPEMLSPTLGSLLRLAFGVEHFRLQFVPTLVGVGWVVWYYLRRRQRWDWVERMPVLLLASYLTASYGAWPFDLVVLLVPVLQAAVWIVERDRPSLTFFGLVTFLGFNVMAFLLRNVRYTDQYWYAWMTPMLLYSYLVLRKQAHEAPAPAAGSVPVWRWSPGFSRLKPGLQPQTDTLPGGRSAAGPRPG